MKLELKNFINLLLTFSAVITGTAAVEVGDSIPDNVHLHLGFPPISVNVKEELAGKNVILVGLPGAFTPTCTTRQVPGYLANLDALKEVGIDEVLIYCVNDGAVMTAWAESQGVPEDSIVKLMGDPYGELTEKLDMELTHAGPKANGLINRCKRFALYVVDGVVKIVRVAERDDDPAGDAFPDITLAESMVEAIKALQAESKNDEL